MWNLVRLRTETAGGLQDKHVVFLQRVLRSKILQARVLRVASARTWRKTAWSRLAEHGRIEDMNETYSTHQTTDPSTERTWAILSHLSLIISSVVSVGMLSFVGPLIVWFIYKDKSDFVRNAAAGSFNFAVTLALASAAATVLAFTVILLPVSFIIWAVVYIVSIVIPILAAMAASRHEMYRYPLTLPLLR